MAEVPGTSSETITETVESSTPPPPQQVCHWAMLLALLGAVGCLLGLSEQLSPGSSGWKLREARCLQPRHNPSEPSDSETFPHIQASTNQTNVCDYLIGVVSVMKPSVLFVQLLSLIIDQK